MILDQFDAHGQIIFFDGKASGHKDKNGDAASRMSRTAYLHDWLEYTEKSGCDGYLLFKKCCS